MEVDRDNIQVIYDEIEISKELSQIENIKIPKYHGCYIFQKN